MNLLSEVLVISHNPTLKFDLGSKTNSSTNLLSTLDGIMEVKAVIQVESGEDIELGDW